MAPTRRARFTALTVILSRLGFDDAPSVIVSGRVLVDGRVVSNPAARVRADSAIRVLPVRRLKGDVKLSFALDRLEVPVGGRVALDLGASAGGFTSALLSRGARRVYALDAGVGQLRSELRNDSRVVNLEGYNLGVLDTSVISEVIEFVTVDLSYLALASAIPQLGRIELHSSANLLVLVKPTFELRRGTVARSEADVGEAISIVSNAMEASGWAVLGQCFAPTTGRRQSREAFLLGRRTGRSS
jgi:23S rRNA (cytidine1920-2'-O)/16S rRNA (cytidine1409-2'-O)-methyltransferase